MIKNLKKNQKIKKNLIIRNKEVVKFMLRNGLIIVPNMVWVICYQMDVLVYSLMITLKLYMILSKIISNIWIEKIMRKLTL